MSQCTLAAAAKINLYLRILGPRGDGYHAVAMVLQSVNLRDMIHIATQPRKEMSITCDHPQVPTDTTNLALRAAHLLAEQFPKQATGLTIHIEKYIPVAAGLAGGSSNGAALLVGLNHLWNLGLTLAELQSYAARLGSDMPFCVQGGTALGTGRGELLEPLPPLTGGVVVLAKFANLSISTPWAYRTYGEQFSHTFALASVQESDHFVQVLARHILPEIATHLHNDFEKVVLPAHPEIERLKQGLLDSGAWGSLLSGSGPTVFALYPDLTLAKQAIAQLKIDYSGVDFWVAEFCPWGIEIVT
ncbi:4-diphosphocytidyl-2-C-methyl-D-erythritol kinase [Gloeomargarita lithophora Alchichica-D10]|uniref:4-diphosphocytidyl-2-C-methyl-D-erythritol kinase n=1 Tax=Gloeomargarita lithophora Alchichica-D10 TaxID=1188229 RepID=A0A1J0AAA3_9CYAN|nr:4-(cytidine 5'-diphospho)-2-C-methyl-D-erythritol kinase [Gloeomargarita lithophora]APB32862.1 4-diphosphocytidyl-2-C-methyl-D-erythritol kinase [Gloeomargarita lithophora Alchichica-D10]